MAHAAAIAAVQALWTTYWPHGTTYDVIWRSNALDVMPQPGADPTWVELDVQFLVERTMAVGSGLRANEKHLSGRVMITVHAALGSGETTSLALLDAALDVFRSRRSGALSFIGDAVFPMPGPSEDGLWWDRSAVAAFTYRFQG